MVHNGPVLVYTSLLKNVSYMNTLCISKASWDTFTKNVGLKFPKMFISSMGYTE